MKQHGLLASGGGRVDRCIRFWNRLTGQALRSVDTGSQVCNIAWSIHSNELDCENFRSNRPRLKIRNRNWSIMPIKLNDNDPKIQGQLRMIESLNNKSGFILPSGKQLS
ncbi:unnamed protein product [Schistosoma intercalatum]|nr:unnamed protein product [Schistosoma intercalatum]